MFKKVLIANRGEIALRVVRACRDLGIRTVAVHSTADRNSLHVRFADESICIGPPAARDSYLNIPAIMSAAHLTGADAVHPGYGFLSENARFAEICERSGIQFVGPTSESIALMGNKVAAKRAAAAAKVPLVPGSPGPVASAEEAEAIAEHVGYPVLLKASAGGGGKGMKVVRERSELHAAFQVARGEALAAFGDGSMYLEKYFVRPRHVEIQVFADHHGKVVHLGERECSMQRRHQKVLEEAPSVSVDKGLRDRMGAAAIELCRNVGYRNAGTVEFLLAPDGGFYFIEMNTRIQVEHPVTEAVTGLDLVQMQLRVAAGEKLPVSQRDVRIHGHAIECRVNAEDPIRFSPSPGRIVGYHEPGGFGVRVDSFVHDQAHVLPHYDSLVAKLVVWGESRDEAIRRMRRALHEYVIEGIQTTIPFHLRLLSDPEYVANQIHTRFLDKYLPAPAPAGSAVAGPPGGAR